MVCLCLFCVVMCPCRDASTTELMRCSGSLQRWVRISPGRKWWQVLRVAAVSILVCFYRQYFWVLKGCFWEEVRSPANWRATQHKTTTHCCWAHVRPLRGEVMSYSWHEASEQILQMENSGGVQLVLHMWASVKWWGAPRRPPRAVHTLRSNIRSHYMEFWYFWWGLSVTKRRPDWKVLKKVYNWWQIATWTEWHFPKDFRAPSSTVLQLLRTEPQHSGLQVVGHSARAVHVAGSQYTCVSNGIQWDTQVVIIWSPMNY